MKETVVFLSKQTVTFCLVIHKETTSISYNTNISMKNDWIRLHNIKKISHAIQNQFTEKKP